MDTTQERYHDIFFYGLYMDPEMLRDYGVEPRNPQKAEAQGRKLLIGKNATLVQEEKHNAQGMVYSLSSQEIDALYKDAGLEQYRPEALSVILEDGNALPVLCYTLMDIPYTAEPNPSYAQKLKKTMEALGLDSSGVPHTEEQEKNYDFALYFPDPDEAGSIIRSGIKETTQSLAIRAGILGIDHFSLDWLVLYREDGWSQTLFAGSSWMQTPLLCVSKEHSVFREGFSEEKLLEIEPALKPSACGWCFSDMNIAMDGMASRYLSLHIKPKLSKVFEKIESFELHFHKDTEVLFPDWLHASSHAEHQAIALYAFPDKVDLKRLEKEVAKYIRPNIGWFKTRAWRKQYRKFYGIDNG